MGKLILLGLLGLWGLGFVLVYEWTVIVGEARDYGEETDH